MDSPPVGGAKSLIFDCLVLTIVVSIKRSLRSLRAQNYSERKALFAVVDKACFCKSGLPYPEGEVKGNHSPWLKLV